MAMYDKKERSFFWESKKKSLLKCRGFDQNSMKQNSKKAKITINGKHATPNRFMKIPKHLLLFQRKNKSMTITCRVSQASLVYDFLHLRGAFQPESTGRKCA